MKKVLVTGANGFIGTMLCKKMTHENFSVYGAERPGEASLLPEGVEAAHIESIDGNTEWKNILEGINIIIHLAARVHIMKGSASDPFAEYREVNVMGSHRLALTAGECGVKRFIYMSSVKVNGEENVRSYKESDTPVPSDPYGISKWEAEQVLHEIADKTGMEVVVLRPPLVYGPGVKANFFRLFEAVERGIPLPLANVDNLRSLIYLENLVDAVITCTIHPKAAGQTYMVSDNEDISTPELIRRTGESLGRPPRLFSLPPVLIDMAGFLLGKSADVKRLTGSLTVDCSKIRKELDWTPPFSMAQGLNKTAQWYLNERRGLKQ